MPGSCALGDQKSGANCAPYYARDARTFASWGVDYVKLDWCLGKDKPPGGSHEELTAAFHAALNQTGRPMWLNFHCDDVYADWCAAHGNSWRATHDHHDVWENTASTIEGMAEGARTSGPYRWADPDFLMTGGAGCDAGIMRAGERCPGQTEAEYRTEFALWSLWSAPLLVASDLRNMTAFQRSVLLNRELIAVNQDALGASYGRVGGWHCKEGPAACQLWAKPLAGGGAAVGLFNAGSDPHRITFNLTLLPEFAAAGRARARDLWAGRDAGVVAGAVTAEVAPHDTAVFRLSPA